MNALLQRAVALYEVKHYDRAAAEAAAYLETDPESAVAHRLLAACLAFQKKYEQATRHAETAVALAPEDAYSHLVLADVYRQQDLLEKGQEAALSAMELNIMLVEAHALSGDIYLRTGQWTEAIIAAQVGLAIEPDHPGCLNVLATGQALLGDVQMSRATLDAALQQAPENTYSPVLQGWLQLENGNVQEAASQFEAALRLNPENQWARLGVVECRKARWWFYRWLLYSPKWRRGAIVKGYVGQRVIVGVDDRALWRSFVLVPYAFCGYFVLLMEPLFNWIVLAHPRDRYALSNEQRRGCYLFAAIVGAAAAVFLGSLLVADLAVAALNGMLVALLHLPGVVIYYCRRGWMRTTGWLIFAAVGSLGAVTIQGVTTSWRDWMAADWVTESVMRYLVVIWLSSIGIRWLIAAGNRRRRVRYQVSLVNQP